MKLINGLWHLEVRWQSPIRYCQAIAFSRSFEVPCHTKRRVGGIAGGFEDRQLGVVSACHCKLFGSWLPAHQCYR